MISNAKNIVIFPSLTNKVLISNSAFPWHFMVYGKFSFSKIIVGSYEIKLTTMISLSSLLNTVIDAEFMVKMFLRIYLFWNDLHCPKENFFRTKQIMRIIILSDYLVRINHQNLWKIFICNWFCFLIIDVNKCLIRAIKGMRSWFQILYKIALLNVLILKSYNLSLNATISKSCWFCYVNNRFFLLKFYYF